MKTKNQIKLDETAMEYCQILQEEYVTDDLSYICKLALSKLVESVKKKKKENDESGTDETCSIYMQKGMNDVIIQSQMIRFDISREEYNAQYLKMLVHAKNNNQDLQNIEGKMFSWLKHNPEYGDKKQDSTKRKKREDYSDKGYSPEILELGLSYRIAESQRVRFGLSVEEYNKIAHNLLLLYENVLYENPSNTKDKAEHRMFGECRKYNYGKSNPESKQKSHNNTNLEVKETSAASQDWLDLQDRLG